jgi:hypothetical protein
MNWVPVDNCVDNSRNIVEGVLIQLYRHRRESVSAGADGTLGALDEPWGALIQLCPIPDLRSL